MIVIVGAGPTGLGAAYRLQESGVTDFVLLEATDLPGGLAGSRTDDRGFTWDLGGHVQFSHYRYYDDVLDRALGDAWLHHERESWVHIRNRFVPYPFQNNIHRLDAEDRDRALRGLEEAAAHRDGTKPRHFRDWIDTTFGAGLADLFLYPYNFKVWGYPLETLGVTWMGERVAVPDLDRIRENIRTGRDDVSWGPNRTFRFPRNGGTGAIWKAVARLIEPSRIRFESPVRAVDTGSRRLTLQDGSQIAYDRLISTMPLDTLCRISSGLDDGVGRAADSLVHSSCHILGVGLRGGKPPGLRKKCWIYFPENNSPYYRITVFDHYSPNNVPEGAGHWSLMAEVCESPAKPVDASTLERRTLDAMREDGLIGEDATLVSFWRQRLEHGYPTPFLGRDEVLSAIRPALEAQEIYSRGRFGAWRYEVSNQDHSFMQGVEVVDRILGHGEEPTLNRPDYVNGGAFLEKS